MKSFLHLIIRDNPVLTRLPTERPNVKLYLHNKVSTKMTGADYVEKTSPKTRKTKAAEQTKRILSRNYENAFQTNILTTNTLTSQHQFSS